MSGRNNKKSMLNIGCGSDIRKGWINLDVHKNLGADIVFDLGKIYKKELMPFEDGEFDVVLISHVLEDFIDPVPIMKEMERITKPAGKIIIQVPFHTHLYAQNIYHKRSFTIGTLSQYTGQGNYGQDTKMKLVKWKYYSNNNNKATFGYWYAMMCVAVGNLVGYNIFENTPLQYMFCNLDIEIEFKRVQI